MNPSKRLVVCLLFAFVFVLSPSVYGQTAMFEGRPHSPKDPILVITSGGTAIHGTYVGQRAEPCEILTAQLNQVVAS